MSVISEPLGELEAGLRCVELEVEEVAVAAAEDEEEEEEEDAAV